ncbi:casein kinase II, regulatory subunit [Chlamydoabsidia padenii]|nr:casein kinase II, regulatory subunit [Chlamydoabsidia padenii]
MSVPLTPSSDFSFGQWFATLFEKKSPSPPSSQRSPHSPAAKRTKLDDQGSRNSTTTSTNNYQVRRVKYWVDWFLGLNGNDYFCKVDDSFIMDRFNLTKLDEYIPCYYSEALDMLTDHFDYREYDQGTRMEIEKMARHLYGLIHARFILTNTGMAKMMIKYKQEVYGNCPRYFCKNQPLLPVGISDQPLTTSLKLFCPYCKDVYNVSTPRHSTLDGAYFGTTFAHLFLQSNPSLVPVKLDDHYVPRIFGFKINSNNNNSNNTQQLLHPRLNSTSSDYQTFPSASHLPLSTNSTSLSPILPSLV